MAEFLGSVLKLRVRVPLSILLLELVLIRFKTTLLFYFVFLKPDQLEIDYYLLHRIINIKTHILIILNFGYPSGVCGSKTNLF